MATLLSVAAVMFFARALPIFVACLMSIYLGCRFARERDHRAVALGVLAFLTQYLLVLGPFMWLHQFVGGVDAAVLRGGLRIAGFDVTGSGTSVINVAQNFGIDIFPSCSSFPPVAVMIPGAIITILGWRGWLCKSDLLYLGSLLTAGVCVNWLRLALMVLSREGYLYWHSDDGESVVAMSDAALTIGFGYLAARHGQFRSESQ
jgi:hypothetical protein